jgi:hypothetical protein
MEDTPTTKAAETVQGGTWTAEDAALDDELSQLIWELEAAIRTARGNSRRLIDKAHVRACGLRSNLRAKSYPHR